MTVSIKTFLISNLLTCSEACSDYIHIMDTIAWEMRFWLLERSGLNRVVLCLDDINFVVHKHKPWPDLDRHIKYRKQLKCIDVRMAVSQLKSPKSTGIRTDTRSVGETGSTDN